jgi:AraC family transcriptional regulator of adaptative response / DNA-3-methyladenine glycosylase II
MSEFGEHESWMVDTVGTMKGEKTDKLAVYQALTSRDPRFDGVFYVGVTSTGIYCRPVCPAKTPKLANCLFFESAEAAEKASFRPCLRCRPELAPGRAPVDEAHRIAGMMVQRMEEGMADDGASLEDIAAEFEISSRHLRRILRKELGVSPVEMRQTRRLLLAKQLLTETQLPVIEIAFASGFSSLRRFNDAFSRQYRLPPSKLRTQAKGSGTSSRVPSGTGAEAGGTSIVQLAYRPPYDWEGILAFLRGRMISGVESVTGESYARTVEIGACRGWIKVEHRPEKRALLVEFTHTLTPALPALLGRLRRLFDLSARPDLIAAHLAADPMLKEAVTKNPGLRVPGAFDGFEMAVRAVLGQQITVKAATTMACRYAEAFGEPLATSVPGLTRLSPLAGKVALAPPEELMRLGLIGTRARTILALAECVRVGSLRFDAGHHPEKMMARLQTLPGIGPWTAHYLAMRALQWPDAFPKEDVALRKSLGNVTAARAEEISQAWRPWRSYAVLHLWRHPPA